MTRRPKASGCTRCRCVRSVLEKAARVLFSCLTHVQVANRRRHGDDRGEVQPLVDEQNGHLPAARELQGLGLPPGHWSTACHKHTCVCVVFFLWDLQLNPEPLQLQLKLHGV